MWQPPADVQRRIVAAANQHEDGKIILGIRHWDDFMRQQLEYLPRTKYAPHHWQQGFVDQFGQFYTRQEAFQVAAKAHQIIRSVGGEAKDGGTLYSEHLY